MYNMGELWFLLRTGNIVVSKVVRQQGNKLKIFIFLSKYLGVQKAVCFPSYSEVQELTAVFPHLAMMIRYMVGI